MKNIISSIVFKVIVLTLVAVSVSPVAKAETAGAFVTESNGVRVMRIGQNSAGYRVSFFHSYRDPVLVTYHEVYSDGLGPERFVEVHGGRHATVSVNTPTVEITHTEAMADERPTSSGPSHGHGYYP
jgi:hypothetical protein